MRHTLKSNVAICDFGQILLGHITNTHNHVYTMSYDKPLTGYVYNCNIL